MSKNTKIKFITQIIESLIVVIVGVLTIIFANKINYWNVLGYIAASLITIDGLISLFLFFNEITISINYKEIAKILLETTIGIFLFIYPTMLVRYFSLFVAIALCIFGVCSLIYAIISNVNTNASTKRLIILYLVSTVSLALGILALVYFPYDSTETAVNTISILLIIIGTLFIILGTFIFIYLIKTLKVIKKATPREGKRIIKTYRK